MRALLMATAVALAFPLVGCERDDDAPPPGVEVLPDDVDVIDDPDIDVMMDDATEDVPGPEDGTEIPPDDFPEDDIPEEEGPEDEGPEDPVFEDG